jgi:hypothetical protein
MIDHAGAMSGALHGPIRGIQWQHPTRRTVMTRHAPFAIEIAAQFMLAAAVGCVVSLVLAGIVLLLAS